MLSSYLNSQYALPDSLLPHLDEFLEDRAELIQFCDVEIARLERQRTRLRSQWMQYAALRAPIRRLAPEILAIIIHWAIGGPGYFVGQLERAEFLRLRQVSKLWRQTALYTPDLWRYLSVNISDGSDNQVTCVALKERMDGWYGRAGRGAKVHLDLRAWGLRFGDPSKWIEAIWGGEERTYTLATAKLFGTHIVVSDLVMQWPAMSHLENLSIRQGMVGAASERAFMIGSLFPSLTSLTIRMPPSARPLKISQPLRHPRLCSLYLSGLSFDQRMLSRSLDGLPQLEELLLHNCLCTGSVSAFHLINNSSVKRLIVSLAMLSAWRAPTFTNLEYCKIVEDDAFLLGNTETFEVAISGGDALAGLSSHRLTLDLTSTRLEAGHLLALLSRLSSLRSLWVKSLQLLLFAEDETEEIKTDIEEIVCASCSPLPFHVATTPMDDMLPSSGTILMMYTPDEHQSSRSQCVDPNMRFMRGIPFHFVRIPQWRIDTMVYEQFAIRHYEREEFSRGY
jgi:hypothetical protein